jgi:translocation protein SEC63
MAGMKFEYDENGAKFVYFVLSFYAMIIIPMTYYFWPRRPPTKTQHAEDLSSFEPCRLKTQKISQNEPKKNGKVIKFGFLIAWAIFAILAYKASLIEIEHGQEYDPFAILNIDKDSSDKEIRKQYRELSKTMHPDKGGSEEAFKELTKAYKALTDEEAKENYKKYGNPDGPGIMQFGIALPMWIVDGKNSYIVLGIYFLIFMIIMPTIVGLWWYKSIKNTGDGVLLRTSQLYNYLIMKSPQMNLKRVAMILGSSFEFERHQNPEIKERETDNFELPQLMKDLPDLQEKIKELPFSYPYSIKARILIHAHLARLTLSDNLVVDKNVVIKKSPFLINEMVNTVSNIVSAVNSNYAPKGCHAPRLETMENIMKLSPMVVQGLWNKSKKCDLLQMPHLVESQLRHFVTKKRNIQSIRQFVVMNDSDRRSILRNLTDEQYDDIMRVCAQYPHVDMDVKVKVIDDEDEKTITQGALVTLVVNLKRQNLKVMFNNDETHKHKAIENNTTEDNNNNDNNDNNDMVMVDGVGAEASVTAPVVIAPTVNKPWKDTSSKKKPKKPKAKAVKPKAKPAAAAQATTNKKDENNSDKDNESDENDDSKNSDANNNNSSENESEDESKSKSKVENLSADSTTKTTTTSQKSADDGDAYFEKFQQMQKKKEKLETKGKVSHRVYCPFFPDIKQECWWLYVADKKQNAILSSPVYVCALKDTEEQELRFLAPKTPGVYTYTVCLRSDSYIDFDVFENIKLDVKAAKKIEDHPQWNFADDDEEANGAEEVDDEYNTESENDD